VPRNHFFSPLTSSYSFIHGFFILILEENLTLFDSLLNSLQSRYNHFRYVAYTPFCCFVFNMFLGARQMFSSGIIIIINSDGFCLCLRHIQLSFSYIFFLSFLFLASLKPMQYISHSNDTFHFLFALCTHQYYLKYFWGFSWSLHPFEGVASFLFIFCFYFFFWSYFLWIEKLSIFSISKWMHCSFSFANRKLSIWYELMFSFWKIFHKVWNHKLFELFIVW
jgi:hypothetical protein